MNDEFGIGSSWSSKEGSEQFESQQNSSWGANKMKEYTQVNETDSLNETDDDIKVPYSNKIEDENSQSSNNQKVNIHANKGYQNVQRSDGEPVDIFDLQSKNEDADTDDDTQGEIQKSGHHKHKNSKGGHQHGHSKCGDKSCKTDHGQFQPQDDEEEEDNQKFKVIEARKKVFIDVFQSVGLGSFHPAALLILKRHIDPRKVIVDPNSGALIPHYACHHGNLKFLRWLIDQMDQLNKEEGTEREYDFRDQYKCGLAHYAVRQGHLPVLMYVSEVLQLDLKQQDQYGFSPLDYALYYKKLYCFIYLYFSLKITKINQNLVFNICQSLCTPDPAPPKNNKVIQYEVSDSMKLIQLILRTESQNMSQPSLSSIFGPVLLQNAIQQNRLDIIKEVYENCHYLPNLAISKKSTSPITQNLSLKEDQIKVIVQQLDNMPHLTFNERISIKSILNGNDIKLQNSFNQNWIKVNIILIAMIFAKILLYLLIVHISSNIWQSNDIFGILSCFYTPFSTLYFYNKDKNKIYEDLSQKGLNGTVLNSDEQEILKQNYDHSTQFYRQCLYLVFLIFYIALSIQQFLRFSMCSSDGRPDKIKYVRGPAIKLLAQKMRLRRPNNQISYENLRFLDKNFTEICFETLWFKDPQIDYCPVHRCDIIQNHGFSNFFQKSINFKNFRRLTCFLLVESWFLTLTIFYVLFNQKVMKLQSSNKFLRFIEIHLVTAQGLFKSGNDNYWKNFILFFTLFSMELYFQIVLNKVILHLYAISRQMTLRELLKPWLYFDKPNKQIFRVKYAQAKVGPLQKQKIQAFYEFNTEQASLKKMMINLLNYFCVPQDLKHEITQAPADINKQYLWHQNFEEEVQQNYDVENQKQAGNFQALEIQSTSSK